MAERRQIGINTRKGVGGSTLAPGMWVALGLRDNTAPLRSYIGEVQAVDSQGVRITLMDFFVDTPLGYDFFASWSIITSALVATSPHDRESFLKEAEAFQSQMETQRASRPDPEKSE